MDIKLIPSLVCANMENPGKEQSYGEINEWFEKIIGCGLF